MATKAKLTSKKSKLPSYKQILDFMNDHQFEDKLKQLARKLGISEKLLKKLFDLAKELLEGGLSGAKAKGPYGLLTLLNNALLFQELNKAEVENAIRIHQQAVRHNELIAEEKAAMQAESYKAMVNKNYNSANEQEKPKATTDNDKSIASLTKERERLNKEYEDYKERREKLQEEKKKIDKKIAEKQEAIFEKQKEVQQTAKKQVDESYIAIKKYEDKVKDTPENSICRQLFDRVTNLKELSDTNSAVINNSPLTPATASLNLPNRDSQVAAATTLNLQAEISLVREQIERKGIEKQAKSFLEKLEKNGIVTKPETDEQAKAETKQTLYEVMDEKTREKKLTELTSQLDSQNKQAQEVFGKIKEAEKKIDNLNKLSDLTDEQKKELLANQTNLESYDKLKKDIAEKRQLVEILKDGQHLNLAVKMTNDNATRMEAIQSTVDEGRTKINEMCQEITVMQNKKADLLEQEADITQKMDKVHNDIAQVNSSINKMQETIEGKTPEVTMAENKEEKAKEVSAPVNNNPVESTSMPPPAQAESPQSTTPDAPTAAGPGKR